MPLTIDPHTGRYISVEGSYPITEPENMPSAVSAAEIAKALPAGYPVPKNGVSRAPAQFTVDPVALLSQLNSDLVTAKIVELEGQLAALRVLLSAVEARENANRSHQGVQPTSPSPRS